MATLNSITLVAIILAITVGAQREGEDPVVETDPETNQPIEPVGIETQGQTTILSFVVDGKQINYTVDTELINAAGLSQNIYQCIISGGQVRRTKFGFKCKGRTITTTTTTTTTPRPTTTTVTSTAPTPTTTGNYDENIVDEPKRGRNADVVPDFPVFGYPLVKACADIVIVFDGSCSVKKEYKDAGIKLVQAISNSLVLDDVNGACIGALVYDGVVTQHVDFDFGDAAAKGSESFSDRFGKLDTTPSVCRTKTWIAFRYANKRFFTGDNDREDGKYKDLMLVVGDGRTAPVTRRSDTIKQAKALKADNVTIAYIQMPHKVDSKTKESLENEIKEITDPDKIFDILDPRSAISGILGILNNPIYSCEAK